MAKHQPKKLSWWHDAIIDWMIVNPDKLLRDCAEAFDVTQPWLSVVINSDLFKEKLALRKDEHFAGVSATTQERLCAARDLSLDVLNERIERERDDISLALVKDTAEMTLRMSGFGAPAARDRSAPQVVVVNGVGREELAAARALMHSRENAIDTTAEEVDDAELATEDAALSAAR